MAKKVIKIKIPAQKARAGHQSHITGTGPHKDKRLKRKHTRSQQKKNLDTDTE